MQCAGQLDSGGSAAQLLLQVLVRLANPTQCIDYVTGQAFVQNLRRGHHEIVADHPPPDRVRAAFEDLAFRV